MQNTFRDREESIKQIVSTFEQAKLDDFKHDMYWNHNSNNFYYDKKPRHNFWESQGVFKHYSLDLLFIDSEKLRHIDDWYTQSPPAQDYDTYLKKRLLIQAGNFVENFKDLEYGREIIKITTCSIKKDEETGIIETTIDMNIQSFHYEYKECKKKLLADAKSGTIAHLFQNFKLEYFVKRFLAFKFLVLGEQ